MSRRAHRCGAPEGKRHVSIQLLAQSTSGAADLTSFDPVSSSWVAEAGTYTVSIGASSADIRRSGAFEVAREIVVRKTNKAVVPRVNIRELRPGV